MDATDRDRLAKDLAWNRLELDARLYDLAIASTREQTDRVDALCQRIDILRDTISYQEQALA